jgi:hypothetical protein
MNWRIGTLARHCGGAAAGLALGLGAAGYCLPDTQEAGRSLILQKPVAGVWETLAGDSVWSEWRRRMRSLPIESVEIDPRRRLVRRMGAANAPVAVTWTVEVAPYGRGSLITVVERTRVPNPYTRLFVRIRDPNASVDALLTALAHSFGEAPRIGDLVALL